MPFRSNAHTHSTWCDGRNSPSEMLEAARKLGFVSLGFSGHAAQGFDFVHAMSDACQRGYFDELRSIQRSAPPLRVWAGLELDALVAPRERDMAREADYLIGSTHYLMAEPGGEGVAVDGAPDRLRAYADSHFSGDGLALARRFFEISTDFLLSQRPEIIGHFDLVRMHAARLRLFDERDPAYRRLALGALERAYPCGGVLEVNTGGLARGYLPTPYPTLELLCAWREMGGRVTITSDCHDCRYLNYAFDQAEALVREAGFRSVARLGTGDALWEEDALSI